MKNKILLSFDLEEFDIPEEYGTKLADHTKFEISNKGVKFILDVLERLDIRATFFTTANYAQNNKSLVKKISQKHEIASHGFYHSSFSEKDYFKSKKLLKKITSKEINGFRMPRLKNVNFSRLSESGYLYDSSINPTYLPGRYNNLWKNRKIHKIDKITEIPISVLPIVRFPLFWISFKNLPLPMFKFFSALTLKKDNYLNIFFHPWEFSDIDDFNLPKLVSEPNGKKLLKKLENYLIWLRKNSEFVTFSEFIHSTRKEI